MFTVAYQDLIFPNSKWIKSVYSESYAKELVFFVLQPPSQGQFANKCANLFRFFDLILPFYSLEYEGENISLITNIIMEGLLSNIEMLSWSNVHTRPYLCLEFEWIVAYTSLPSKSETKADIYLSHGIWEKQNKRKLLEILESC